MSATSSDLELADIVRLMAYYSPEELHKTLGFLGVNRLIKPEKINIQLPKKEKPQPPELRHFFPPPPPPPPPPKIEVRKPLSLQYWVVTGAKFEPKKNLAPSQTVPSTPKEIEYDPLQSTTNAYYPLATKKRWWPALNKQRDQRSYGVNIKEWVRLSALAKWPTTIPKKQAYFSWQHASLIIDTSFHLVPFNEDFLIFLKEIKKLKIAERLDIIPHRPGHGLIKINAASQAVFILSDLGSCTRYPQDAAETWLNTLKHVLKKKLPIMAWVPSSSSRIPQILVGHIKIFAWHEASNFLQIKKNQALNQSKEISAPNKSIEQLRSYLSMCFFAEPALLRRLRLLCDNGRAHPELESMIWAFSDPDTTSYDVAQIHYSKAQKWREKFKKLELKKQIEFYKAITEQHSKRQRSTLFFERILFETYTKESTLPELINEEIKVAKEWFEDLKTIESQINERQDKQMACKHQVFLSDLMLRIESDKELVNQNAKLTAGLATVMGLDKPKFLPTQAWLKENQKILTKNENQLWAMVVDNKSNSQIFLKKQLHKNSQLKIALTGKTEGIQSTNATNYYLLSPIKRWRYGSWESGHDIETSNISKQDQLSLLDDLGLHTFSINKIQKQDWQNSLGQDQYGVFCDVKIKEVIQRFRFIPPGTFLMGAPDTEEGALDREKPQHLETIQQGFWLANTPCTQELWQAVMGNNPSHFKDGNMAAQRPVENIAYSGHKDSAETFLKRLQTFLPPELKAELPTEIEWEYACRAQTKSAYWWGDKFDEKKANTNGKLNATTPVLTYPPNPWGLYDMHGNVWEWTSSAWKANLADVKAKEDVSQRVMRGGSWGSPPDFARAAFRSFWHLDVRNRSLGLRLLLRSYS